MPVMGNVLRCGQRFPLRRFDLPLVPRHVGISRDRDRHVVLVLQMADLGAFLVEEVLGHFIGEADPDLGGEPLDGLGLDLPVGGQGRVFERRPDPPPRQKGQGM